MAAEKTASPRSGYLMLFVGITLLILTVYLFIGAVSTENAVLIAPILLCLFLGLLSLIGLFVVNPNDSRVLILFGTYKGSVKKNGFFWANPFLSETIRRGGGLRSS